MESGDAWIYLKALLISTQTHLRISTGFTLVTRHLEDAPSVPPQTDSSTTFDEKLETIRGWLGRCQSGAGHAECRPTPFAPSRLVSVGHDGGSLRLVERAPTAIRSQYTTLSYCWGTSPTLRTTKATLPTFTKEIPLATMPKTFLDAVRITRGLGIPYIWIDALCIVQDDEEAWQNEAACMSDIYKGSQLTIAAAMSEDATSGCFPRVDKPRRGDVSFHARPPGRTIFVRAYRGDLRDRGRVASVLNTRGWTLQEQLLSPRILFCMGPDARWQCQASYLTQCGLAFDPRGFQTGSLLARASRLNNRSSMTTWQSIIEDYSGRVFTHLRDRIPAIAGVTRHLASTTDDRPILGLWAKTFAGDLAWARFPGEPQMDDVRGLPSWTWLACRGGVDYLFTTHSARDHTEVVDSLELLGFDLQWLGVPYTSGVERAQATVKGKIRHIQITPSAEGDAYNPPYLQVFGEEVKHTATNTLPWRCSGQFDAPDARREGTHPCLLLSTVRYDDGRVQQTFLILEPVKGLGYRRVGVAKLINSPPAFDSAETISVVLV